MLRRGAEAEITSGEWRGRPVVFKRRLPKGYRHPELDLGIRTARTKMEAKMLSQARGLGVPTPLVYDVDLDESTITMMHVRGERLKDLLASADDEVAARLCIGLGKTVARLHNGGLVHGDLTTSNMIVMDDRIYLIDLSLGGRTEQLEEMGVDLHLLQEAMESTHAERPGLFERVMDGYLEVCERGREVLIKLKDIEKRGRYR